MTKQPPTLFTDNPCDAPRRMRADQETSRQAATPLELGHRAAERAAKASDTAWQEAALQAIEAVCIAHEYFTTDQVWGVLNPMLDARPGIERPTPQALGGMMKRASGILCEPTEHMPSSQRATCHGRPVRKWQSLLRKPGN